MAIKKLDLLRVITSSNYLYNFSSSYSNKAKTASYALNASGGGGSSLRTGSTYPITASYANRAITASYALNASGGGSSLAGAQTFVSNGSQTIYTLNQSVVNRDQILVVTNGVVQSRTGSNYTVSGTTLTLSEAVQSGGLVDVRYINAGQGSSGTSGANGTSGTNGTSGANGTSGTSGAGSTLATGSTYPITSSYARKSVTASYLTTISQSLIPAKNNVYSLGSPTKKWKDIYVSTASIYFDNYPLRVAVKNNSAQLLFNTRSIVTVPSGSNPSTSSYATKALTASYALNASGGGGSTLRTGSTYPITSSYASRAITASYALNTFFQTGSIVKQTILYNVVSGSQNVISGLNLSNNKWGVSIVEEWDSVSGDVYYANTSLLLHFSGSNNSTTIVNDGSNSANITVSGAAKITSAFSKFGGTSLFLGGTNGNYITVPVVSGGPFDVNNQNFTVECYIYITATSTGYIASRYNSSAGSGNYNWSLLISSAGKLEAAISQFNNNNISNTITGLTTLTTNAWNHIAYVKSSSLQTLFLNGNKDASGSITVTTSDSGQSIRIGTAVNLNGSTNAPIAGYIDEFRITKNIARYTSNFITQSVPFPNKLPQYATKYIGLIGGLNDRNVDYGIQKLSDSSLKVVKMSQTTSPFPSGSLSASVNRVYVNVLDYTKVAVTSSYANRSLTASYASRALTASYASRALTASYASRALTASYASRSLTASYALIGGNVLGTTNYLPKFTSGTVIGNSVIYETSNNIGIGTTSPTAKLHVQGTVSGSQFTSSRRNAVGFSGTASYARRSLTASYALNASGGGGSTLRTGSTYPITSSFARRSITASYALNTFFQTGSIVKQTILYNVVSGSSNTISGLSLGGNKWDVSVVEEWDAISGDLFYNSCSLLMHFSGSNGSTTFTDNSPSTKTVTSNNGASISSAQSKFGSRSGLFDGVDDYLIISGNTVCNFGSGDFTVECWVRLNAMPTSDAWPTNFSSHFVVITAGTPSAGDGIGFLIGQTKLIVQSNDTQMPNALHGMTTNTWYHIAYVRRGNNLYFFVNGSQVGTTQTLTGAVGTGTNTYIGCETAQGAFFNGYMDELRVTKGLARYVSNFTTSSTEFGNVRGQVATKYIGTVGGLNDRSVDYGVQKLTDSSLKVIKMSSTALPYPASSGSLSQSVSRVYVNVLDYTKVAVTSSYASRALTASYALNASGGGGSTLRTGSTYPITSSFARRAITASYALNSSGGSTLRTGSTYPITSSYARRAITASYALNASGGGSTLRTGSTYPFTSSWSTRTSAIANSTTNRIPKYTAANTLSTTVSPIFESGSAFIGIGPISTSLVSRLQVYRSGSNSSVFRVDGGSGTLFEVTDALSGSLFSVNDITGLPIFEVFSNNRVIAGTVNSNALVVTGSSVGIGTSTPQTKLHVLGNISGSQFTSSRRNAVGFSGTASYARRSLTASYALNASGGGGGSTLRTGSTYPITSSWSTRTTAIANSTTNRIPKYTAANTLSTTVSPIFESGSAFIGVGPISTSLVSRLQVYRSGSNASVFRVDGGSGTLFEVTDALSGSLFSVNDITGLPIFEVFSNNRVIAGTVNSNALVVTGSNVGIGTSVPAVKLQVSGTIAPAGDNIHPLGRSTNRFSDVFAAQTTIGGLFETGLRTDKLGQLPTGTIVSWEVNGCVASSKEEDELVMGVVKNGKDEPLILGAEPILVTGVVNVGDYIVTSNKVGHGKAIKRGNIFKKDLFGKVIAQALESGNGESYLIKGMIRKM